MTDFLKAALSSERWQTYEVLAEAASIAPKELYHRNILYSKELYVILGGLEVVLRNAYHTKLSQKYGKEDWLSEVLSQDVFYFQHKKQLNAAIKNLTKNKHDKYRIADLVAELNFGFWVHLTNAPYEQHFWIPALRHCFPNKFGPPVRQDLEARLKNLLGIRNKIAHLEPIIRNESQLIQVYTSAYDIISWICPDTAIWFDQSNNFKDVWEKYNQKIRGKNVHQ
ncbi:MAG: hypothetical protein CMH27_02795 [Micavibrio sp.]|nr:hypothetical protein [Micavibrio sp.]|tara:strand:- start:431 stop:1102 length:672 start_codon:yes stop_codon:yes gene_type:complete